MTSRNLTTNFREGTAMPQRLRDVLGRLKVSMHQNIYEADFEYGPQPLRWEAYVQTFDGVSGITAIPSSGGVRMRVGTSLGDITIRQSRPYHRYQPGKTMFMATGFNFGTALPGNVQRVGFFDDSNGVFFEQAQTYGGNPFGIYAVVRTDINGQVQETRVGLDQWTGDQTLLAKIDFNKIQMFWIEYAWYGAGATRWGFYLDGEPFIGHQTGWGNYPNPQVPGGQQGPWARTGNLPVRYEQRNLAGTSVLNDMYHYGVSVIIEGRTDDQRGFTYSYGLPNNVQTRVVPPNTTRFPLLTIRGRQMGTQEFGSAYAQLGNTATIMSSTGTTATFTIGTISTNSTVIGVTAVASGSILTGMQIQGVGIPWGNSIVTQLTSTGSATTATTSSAAVVLGASTVTMSGTAGIVPGQLVSATGIPLGTFVGNISNNIITLVDKFGLSTSTTANLAAKSTIRFYTAGGTGTYQMAQLAPLVTLNGFSAAQGFVQSFGIPTANFTVNQYQGRALFFPGLGTSGNGMMARIVANSTNTLYTADFVVGLGLTALPATGTIATPTLSGGGQGFYTATVSSAAGIVPGLAINGTNITSGTIITYITGTVITVNQPLQGSLSGSGTVTQGYCIGIANRGQLLPKRLMVSSDYRCVVELISNTVINPIVFQGQQPNFVPLSQLGSLYSFAERDAISTSTQNNTGEVVFAFTLAAGSGLQDIDLSYFFPLYNNIRGNQIDSLTLAITTVQGTTATVGGHLICQEAMS
jgi:hypothetical protein